MESQNPTIKKRHVLVVDDEVDLTLAYKQLLEAHNYSVSTAPNGVLALKCILNRDVDAIVCDLKMPQLEGDMFYVTVEKMKPQLCERFIFITGVPDNPKFQPFIRKMESHVLLKPVSGERLLETLATLFARLDQKQ